MKIRADRHSLAVALKRARVENPSSSLPILNGLRGRLLADLVNAGRGELVEISVDSDEATIICGGSVATIRALDIIGWPNVVPAEGTSIEFTSADVDRLARVLRTVASGEEVKQRPILAGVHLAGNRAEAARNASVIAATLSAEGIPDVVVPADVVARVVKSCPTGFHLTVGQRAATFDSGDEDTTWTTTLLVGEFPNVFDRALRKESAYELTANREELADVLDGVKILSEQGEFQPVDLVRDGDKLLVQAARADVGNISDVASCSGSWTEPIRFHASYLADVLRVHDDEQVRFEIEDALKPVIVRSSDWRLVQIVMPMRIPVAS